MATEAKEAIEIGNQLLKMQRDLIDVLETIHNDVAMANGYLCATLDRGFDPRPRVAAEILAAVLRQAGVDLVSEALEKPQRAQVLFARVWRLTDSFLAFGAGMNAAGVWTGKIPATEAQQAAWEAFLDKQAGHEGMMPWPDGEQHMPTDTE